MNMASSMILFFFFCSTFANLAVLKLSKSDFENKINMVDIEWYEW